MEKQNLQYGFRYRPDLPNKEIIFQKEKALYEILMKFVKEELEEGEFYTFRLLKREVTSENIHYYRGYNEMHLYFEFGRADKIVERIYLPTFNQDSLFILTSSATEEIRQRFVRKFSGVNKIKRFFDWLEKKMEMKF